MARGISGSPFTKRDDMLQVTSSIRREAESHHILAARRSSAEQRWHDVTSGPRQVLVYQIQRVAELGEASRFSVWRLGYRTPRALAHILASFHEA